MIFFSDVRFVYRCFSAILIPIKFMGGVRTVIMAGETPDFG